MTEPTYTWEEASATVAKWAVDYNAQTDTPMSIYPLEASNNIDTIKAVEINADAYESGEDEYLLFNVLWS
jgi:hypothetical protein